MGAHYVFDRFASTAPDTNDTFLPTEQKQIILTDREEGVWFFHIVSVDTQGYPTREAQHYQIRIGADPGAGVLLGTVTDGADFLAGARVTVNRGFMTETTDENGAYNFNAAIAGEWELSASAPGYEQQVKSVQVLSEGSATVNFVLSPSP